MARRTAPRFVTALVRSPLLACCGLALLSGCAEPVTRTPGVSAQEIATEAQAHEQAVAAAKRSTTGQQRTLDRQTAQAGLEAVAKRILPAAENYCRQFTGGTACGFDVRLDKDGAPLNAYADGTNVVVSPAMIAFTDTPDELAVVLSHEMAHNILQHPQRAAKNGMLGGLAGSAIDMAAQAYGFNLGGLSASDLGQKYATAKYSQDFERDADYLGIYIDRAAGYDMKVAPSFWQRMSVQDPDGIYSSGSHPTNPERAVMLRKAIDEIQTKERSGQPLMPALRAQK